MDVVRIINLDLFNRSIGVLFTDKSVIPGNTDGLYMWNGGKRLILLDKSIDHLADRYNLITHECYHATTEVLKSAGIKVGDDSEEAYAYTMGHITSSVIGFLLDTDFVPAPLDLENTATVLKWITEVSLEK